MRVLAFRQAEFVSPTSSARVQTAHQRVAPAIWAALLILLLLLAVQAQGWMTSLPVSSLSIFAVFGVVITMIGIRSVVPTRESSASFLFVLAWSLFELGYTPLLALGEPLPNYGGQAAAQVAWIASTQFKQAILASVQGVLALGIGVCLYRVTYRDGRQESLVDADDLALRLGLPVSALMSVSVAAFFILGLSKGGLGIFLGTYDEWSAATQGGLLPFIYASITFSAGMLALATPSRARRVGITSFAFFAVAILVIGLRSYALFPLLAFVAMLSYRRRIATGPRLIVGGLVVLTLISAVAAYRNATPSRLDIGPQFGVAEMGGSLRPLVEVISWRQAGQPALGGMTLAEPILRLAHRTLPFLGPNVPAQQDPYLMNVVTAQRLNGSQIGFSQAADGYINWGLSGLLTLSVLTGLVLGWVDKPGKRLWGRLVRNVVLVALLFWIRNAFTQVPGQLLFGFALSTLVYFGAALKLRQSPRSPDGNSSADQLVPPVLS